MAKTAFEYVEESSRIPGFKISWASTAVNISPLASTMSLKSRFASLFNSRIRDRGLAYFHAGAVKILEHSDFYGAGASSR